MNRTLWLGSDGFTIGREADPAAGVVVDFRDPLFAASFLEQLLADPQCADALRDIAAHELMAPPSDDDQDLVEALAFRLHDRSLRVIRRPATVLGTHGDEPIELPRAKAAPVVETSWIEIKVIEDGTNDPIPKVKLTVTKPDGSEGGHTTNGDGIILIDPIEPGTCGVKSSIDDLEIESTLEIVGFDEGPLREPKEEKQKGSATPRIAFVEHHRVRAGETLAGLAKAAGMSWKELARFNFHTDDPSKINQALRVHVGCTRKTDDRKNYVFSDSDQPGILYVPRKLDRRGMSTGQTHVLRVRRIVRPAKRLVFSH